MPRTINQGFEDVPLSLLKQHPRNANEGDFGAIQQSIETNGFYGAIVANKRTGHILAGNHRYQVAKQSGFDTLPVVWVDVDDEEEIRILIADNRTTRLGNDNESKLAALLSELAATDTGLSGTGFDGEDLDRMIQDLAPKPEQTPDTKTPEGAFVVIIDCSDKDDQDRTYLSLKQDGFMVRRALVKTVEGKITEV